MADTGWTFPLPPEGEVTGVTRFAYMLVNEVPSLPIEKAVEIGAHLYAAQKVAHAIEMVEVKLQRIGDTLNGLNQALPPAD